MFFFFVGRDSDWWIFFFCGRTQEGSAAGGRLAYADVAPSYAGAYIEAPASTRVVAQNGSHAYLPCSVKRLGSKLVRPVPAP